MSDKTRATINLEMEYLEKIDQLGELLDIKPGGGRPGRLDRSTTNRSEAIRRAVDYALRAAAAGMMPGQQNGQGSHSR